VDIIICCECGTTKNPSETDKTFYENTDDEKVYCMLCAVAVLSYSVRSSRLRSI
jgi:hypothetical protein